MCYQPGKIAVAVAAVQAAGCRCVLDVLFGIGRSRGRGGRHTRRRRWRAPAALLCFRAAGRYGGRRFGGLNGWWTYKLRGHFLHDQWEVEEILSAFPGVDILLCHNPPTGIHDQEDEVHYGFDGLNAYITRAKPKALIHGHQHVDEETTVGETRVIGVYGRKMIEI